jgi:PLD-like domain
VCAVEYSPSEKFPPYAVGRYLSDGGFSLEFAGLLDHCKKLADAITSPSYAKERPPLRMLLAALSRAQVFVHFSSWGLTSFFVGVLKLMAQKTVVRGIVSNIDERILDEITDLKTEVPPGNLEIKTFLRGDWVEDPPHQKLIVIDGLLAFKGSANLTEQGWRKAGRGRDHVETVTNVAEVIRLHNKLFSPVWASKSKQGAVIEMSSTF